MNWIEEEITLAELADRFLGLNDFETPEIYDMQSLGIEVETIDATTKKRIFKPITNFVVKSGVSEYYTDGITNGSANHRIIEDGKNIKLQDHPEFHKINKNISVVDIEVPDAESYLSGGRLHHNTTSGGKSLPFHASVRIRLAVTGKIKSKAGDVIGVEIKATILKNRIAPPHKVVSFNIYFDRGIDDYTSSLDFLKETDIVTVSGPTMKYIDVNGEEHKFNSKEWHDFFDAHRAEIYQKMCDALIMMYSTGGLQSEDMEVAAGGLEE